jgi:hypothetical protein
MMIRVESCFSDDGCVAAPALVGRGGEALVRDSIGARD